MDSPDVVASLGYLALGTRLKRLAEQLQSGVADILAERGTPIPPGQLPLLVAIGEGKAMTVAQLVDAVGVSQPAVSRMLGALQAAGLVSMEVDGDDARVRRAGLTPRATQMLEEMRTTIFPKVAAGAAELCEGLDLLDRIATVEDRNRQLPFAERIRRTAP